MNITRELAGKTIALLFLVSFPVHLKTQSLPSDNFTLHLLQSDDLAAPPDEERLEVVSASRTTKKVDDLPVEIYVVTRKDIIRYNCHSLVDVLRTVPGIKIGQPASGSLGESFEIRGLTGNMYTKILINGISVKPTVVQGMPIGYQLPVRQAERIEIIIGPSAAIYGADAMSGVINIILKEPEQGSFVHGDISLGENGYNLMNFMIGGKAGRNQNILKYSFYGGRNEIKDLNIINGYDDAYNPLYFLEKRNKKINIDGTYLSPMDITPELLQEKNINEKSIREEYYHPYYEGDLWHPAHSSLGMSSHHSGLQLDFRGIKLTFDNMYRKTHSSIGQSPYLFRYDDPNNFWGEAINRTTLSYTRPLFSHLHSTTTFSSLFFRMDDRSSLNTTFLPARTFIYSASDDISLEQLLTYNISEAMELVFGGDYTHSKNLPTTNIMKTPYNTSQYGLYESPDINQDTLWNAFGFNPVKFHNISGFFQAYYMLHRSTFMGGIRYDANSMYGASFSPRIAVLQKVGKKTSLSSSLGYAYKAPPASLTFESFAYQTENDSIHYFIAPNQNLKPEKFMAFDLGVKTTLFNIIEFDIRVYYNETKNLILNTYVSPESLDLPYVSDSNDSLLTRKNFGNATMKVYGVHGIFRIPDLYKPWNISVEGSAIIAEKNIETPGLQTLTYWLSDFSNTPRHLGKLNISMQPLQNLYVYFQNLWWSRWLDDIIDSKSKEGFYTLDIICNYQLSQDLNAYCKVINLFDKAYGGVNTGMFGEDMPYNPQTGRSVRLGLTYQLN